ncbi:YidB family protein [Streptomyces mirabilis]
MAVQAGVSPQEAVDQIAQHLPQAVDKLTPGVRVRRPSRQAGAAHSRVAA